MIKTFKTLSAFLLTFLLLSTVDATAKELYNSSVLLRETGAPQTITDTFSAPAINGDAMLTVHNGDPDTADKRVTSAHVILNGNEIFSPDDFKKKMYLMERVVTLEEQNTIEIQIAGAPGTFLSVSATADVVVSFDIGNVDLNGDYVMDKKDIDVINACMYKDINIDPSCTHVDLNLDGLIDDSDEDIFYNALGNSAYDPDLTEDGSVTADDLAIVTNCLGFDPVNNASCALADVNGDRRIDLRDEDMVNAHMGKSGFMFYKPYDPAKIVHGLNGGTFPVNRVSIRLINSAKMEEATTVADFVGGHIVAYVGGTHYILEVPATTTEELAIILAQIESHMFVTYANPSYFFEPQSLPFKSDLLYLSSDKQLPFMAVKVIDAWSLLLQSMVSSDMRLNRVQTSLVDTGVNISHQEFSGSSIWGNIADLGTTTCKGKDVKSHGTSIAGVIAADNKVLFSNSIPTNEISGIASGILGNKLGLQSYRTTFGYDLFKKMKNAAKSSSIVNYSISGIMCQNSSQDCCIPQEDFQKVTNDFLDVFLAHPKTLFVVAAGNNNRPVSEALPSGINEPNVISVGATSPAGDSPAIGNDGKEFSNYGPGVDLSAPGQDVYVPVDNGTAHGLVDGTSIATPMISGAAALLQSIDTDLADDPQALKEILTMTADDESVPGGKVLNIARAVACTVNRKGHEVPLESITNEELKSAIKDDLTKGICGGSNPTLIRSLYDPTPTFGDQFGATISISGQLAVVGSPGHYITYEGLPLYNEGQAFILNARTGRVIRTLNDPEPHVWQDYLGNRQGTLFGQSVAISGNKILVNAPRYFDTDYYEGARVEGARVYLFDANNGALLRTFKDPTIQLGTHRRPLYMGFGEAVAINGNRILIGEKDEEKAYLYDVGGTLLKTFNDPDPSGSDEYGNAVAINGNRILVGEARGNQAHLYDGTTGELIKTLEVRSMSEFGAAVALNESMVLIGDRSAHGGDGQAHLFNAETGEYIRTFDDPTPNASSRSHFGSSIAISEKWVLVGEGCSGCNGNADDAHNKQAHLFDVVTGKPVATINDPTSDGAYFGSPVSIGESSFIIGERGSNKAAPYDSGQVHFYLAPIEKNLPLMLY